MGYQLPICECGEILEYEKSVDVSYRHYLTSKGRISKKKRVVEDTFNVRERLICDTCNFFYEVDHNDKGKIIRGEIIQ
ncbi:hypothetical protein ACFQZE_06665 [Paenibacillus sp. GCM10027627]|uniref:hypothetical protein n=1 Tax=unclassified Paenibacillus TaxID=185978 RepID=UPI003641960F